MPEWMADLLQWAGWAGLGGAVISLLTLKIKDRWEARKAGIEQAKVAVSARTAEIAAAQVIIQERTADSTVMEMATRTYQGLLAAQKERIDGLEGRVGELEGLYADCLKRCTEAEEGRRRDQARFWKSEHPNGG